MYKTFAVLILAWSGLAQAATPKSVVLDVRNMTCPTCNITIEKALGKTPGVTRTQVDLKSATVTVNFDAELTSAPALAHVVTEAGFPAKVRANGK